jgi:hypothetical protein
MERTIEHPDGKPTVRQVYAIARALCERLDEDWPESREQASTLIARLREEDDRARTRLTSDN